jgi:hypothetical protein
VTAAQSEKTRLQLLSYCAALKDKYARIFYSSHVVGSREALDFIAFDDEGFVDFAKSLQRALAP